MDTEKNRMRMRAAFHLCASVCVCGSILGCARDRAPATGPKPYFGPTQSMAQVVAQINQNNAVLPTLRATGHFEARVVDEGKRHFVNGDVTLLYRAPGEVRLVGKKDIAGTVFDAATTEDRYWLIVKGETDTMWHGAIENLDRVDPRQIPIRPDLLTEILGLNTIDPNFIMPPAPTMRFNNDADAYMFNFNVRLSDRWAVQKEVWYDRESKLPRLILLFDADGRIVVRTYLSRHRPIDEDDPDAPRVATLYQVFFPDSGATMRIDLDNLALRGGNPPVPSDATFAFPRNPGVSRQINLDEQARL